jgi:hypothetical protein
MAIKKCKECGHDVSTQAKVCPHCGVKYPGKKHISGIVSILVILVAISFFTHLGDNNKVNSNSVGGTPEVQPTKTAEQIRTEEIAKCFSPWDGSHINLTELIKKEMKSPDSYKHVETRYVDEGNHLLVVTKYRGTNSFGAVVPGTITAETILNCSVTKIIDQQ